MKLDTKKVSAPAQAAKKTRKPRSIENGKSFEAMVSFVGKSNGERFSKSYTVPVKASTLYGAIGRGVRNAMPLFRAEMKTKVKMIAVTVEAYPAE